MALDEVIAEFEALKPAFEFAKGDVQRIADELKDRVDTTTKELIPDATKWESAKIMLDNAFNPGGIEFNVVYLKLQEILKARGFDKESSKVIGDYKIHVYGFEDGILFGIERTGRFDLHKTHLLIKKEFLKVLAPKAYSLKFDDTENVDEGGMHSHYTADLLKDKGKIKTLIGAAKVKYIDDKVHDESNVEMNKLREFKKYLDDESNSRTQKKERAATLMKDCGMKPSLRELRHKNFAYDVYKKLEARAMSGKGRLEGEVEKKAYQNINLEYMWRFGGFNVYTHKKTMWQNIDILGQQTSFDTVLANMKILAPHFEKIYEDIDAVMPNPAKQTS